jgi:hypothetical protein
MYFVKQKVMKKIKKQFKVIGVSDTKNEFGEIVMTVLSVDGKVYQLFADDLSVKNLLDTVLMTIFIDPVTGLEYERTFDNGYEHIQLDDLESEDLDNLLTLTNIFSDDFKYRPPVFMHTIHKYNLN